MTVHHIHKEPADWEEIAAGTFEAAAQEYAWRCGAWIMLGAFLAGMTVGMNLPWYLLAWSL